MIINSYTLIVIPPPKILRFVDGLRKKHAKFTSYVIPPHITVYPPFLIKNNNEKEIIDSLRKNLVQVNQQEIALKSVDYFEGKNNVAFFKLDKESSKFIKTLLVITMKSLNGRVKNVYDDYNFTPEKYKPHMTIAEKIPDDSLPLVKKELSSIKKTLDFSIKSVFLYKQKGNSKLWQELKEISFG